MIGIVILEFGDIELIYFWVYFVLSFFDNSKWNICVYKIIKNNLYNII